MTDSIACHTVRERERGVREGECVCVCVREREEGGVRERSGGVCV